MIDCSATAFDAATPLFVSRLGRSDFHSMLVRGLRDAVGADHVSHLTYDRQGRIRQAAAASLTDQPMIDRTTDLYVSRLYERDPNYVLVRAVADDSGGGLCVLPMAAERIRDAEYRRLLFESPGFAGKISLIGRLEGRTCYLNVYFSGGTPDVGDRAAFLQARGRLLLALAHRHDDLVAGAPAPRPAAAAPSGAEPLSLREQQVAVLLREGRTAKEVARALGVAPSTVLTYKARLFEKIGVDNLKQFLLQTPARR